MEQIQTQSFVRGQYQPFVPLKAKGTFGVFASGAAADKSMCRMGRETLEEFGYQVKEASFPSQPETPYHFGNEPPKVRAAKLMELADCDEVDVLLALRGGYGTIHILENLDFERLATAGKPIVGYSDITPLLLNFVQRTGRPAVHGAMLAEEFARYSSSESARESVQELLKLLSEDRYCPSYEGAAVRAAEGEGVLLGGNLSMLASLIGTPWDIDYAGALLMIEEVAEAPYRVHRMLSQLRYAEKFRGIRGVLFGSFLDADGNAWDLDQITALANDVFPNDNIPIVSLSGIGHHGLNRPLPLGVRARIREHVLEVQEALVAEASVKKKR